MTTQQADTLPHTLLEMVGAPLDTARFSDAVLLIIDAQREYVDGKLPLDPWGNAYLFRVPGANGQPFSVVSLGSDGREGGDGLAADIAE